MTAGVIPFARYPGLSPLFLEFLRGGSPFYPDSPTIAAASARGREILGRKSRVPANAWKFRTPRGREEAEALEAGGLVAAMAGHQVGLFTGPLYTVTKAFDAIRAAREIAAAGVPAIAGFWALTDDHDLEEVAKTVKPGATGPETLVLEGADRSNRRPVGPLHLPERAAELLEAFRAEAKAPDAAEVLELFAGHYRAGETYANAFMETLLDLVLPDRLLVLDPFQESLREPAAEFFARAVERREEIDRALREAAARVERAGYPVPVPYREDVFPFFLIENGERRRATDPKEALAKVRNGDAWPSSDVLTRPVFKSFLIPTAASVLGPAEIAYHAQSLALFPIFDVPRPVLLPRSHLVPLGPGERRAAEALGVGTEDLLVPAAEAAPAEDPAEIAEIRRLADDLAAKLTSLEPRLAALDSGLAGAVDTTRQKTAAPLAALAERVRKAAARQDETANARHRRLDTMVRPNGSPAERVYPPLVPMLAYGKDALAAIRAAATGSLEGARVVALGAAPPPEAVRAR